MFFFFYLVAFVRLTSYHIPHGTLTQVLDLDERDLIETQENKEKEQQDQKLKKLAEANLRGLGMYIYRKAAVYL